MKTPCPSTVAIKHCQHNASTGESPSQRLESPFNPQSKHASPGVWRNQVPLSWVQIMDGLPQCLAELSLAIFLDENHPTQPGGEWGDSCMPSYCPVCDEREGEETSA